MKCGNNEQRFKWKVQRKNTKLGAEQTEPLQKLEVHVGSGVSILCWPGQTRPAVCFCRNQENGKIRRQFDK